MRMEVRRTIPLCVIFAAARAIATARAEEETTEKRRQNPAPLEAQAADAAQNCMACQHARAESRFLEAERRTPR
jgi:hypothetical protein